MVCQCAKTGMLGFSRTTAEIRSPLIPAAPPPKRHPYDQWSPDARALDLVGDKWTLLIIRDLAAGPRRFVELQRVLPGISTEQLRSRLNRMVADGLLTRQRYREVPPRVDYELTERSRELMPVLGALAQWGYDWTWTAPRAGEDVNVGAIFRLAPGLLEPPAGLEGAVELIVDAEGEAPERRYLVTMRDGSVEIAERERDGTPTATVRGSVAAWVRALGPEGDLDELEFDGNRSLADGLLTGFADAAARSHAASRLAAPRYFLPARVVRFVDVREGALGPARSPAGRRCGSRGCPRSARPRRRSACSRSWGRCPCPRGRRTARAGRGRSCRGSSSGARDGSPGSRRRAGRTGAGSGRRRRSSRARCRRVRPRRW